MTATPSLTEIVINGRFLMQPVTGVQRVARELTRALDHLVAEQNQPVSLRLVCEPEAELDDLDLRVTTMERAGGANSPWKSARLKGHAWEQFVLPRRVHDGHLLCLGNTAPLMALHARHPTTVMIHDLSYRQFPWAYRLHYRLGHRIMLPSLLRRAQTILTVSEREKAMLAALRPDARGRIHVAQNGGWRDGAGVADLGSEPGDASGAAMDAGMADIEPGYLLYVGSLSRRKNIHGVLAVAIRLAREDGLSTLIVGGGSDILAPIAGEIPADIAHLVRFTGPVTNLAALEKLYRNAGCLLFPSFYEASPLPPVEAMHFGCPVVVSAIPAMTERCGTAAVYCDPHSLDDMAAAVRHVMRDPADRAARGRRHAAHWTWRDQAGQVLAAILGGRQQDARQHASGAPASGSEDGPGDRIEGGPGDRNETVDCFILPDQQAPSPRSTHGTVSTRMRRLSASERERA